MAAALLMGGAPGSIRSKVQLGLHCGASVQICC